MPIPRRAGNDQKARASAIGEADACARRSGRVAGHMKLNCSLECRIEATFLRNDLPANSILFISISNTRYSTPITSDLYELIQNTWQEKDGAGKKKQF
jgi:hypothetical protein